MKSNKKNLKIFSIVISFALIITIGVSVFLFINLSNIKNNPQTITQKETQDVLMSVGKIIILPKDEVPIIATVTDLNALKNQPFFANAKVGDKVLIYHKAGKAILYDPIANKIVELAPLNINNNQQATTS